MRTVLIGAVESSATTLRVLTELGHPPALVATLDPETGRARHSDYVDLGPLAGPDSEVVRIAKVNDPAFIGRVRDLSPDFVFVIGWSQIVGPELRAAAGNCAIGFHPTALPKHRGRAVLAWTILLGELETGCSLFVIDDGVDSGPLLAQERFAVAPREDVTTLMGKHIAALERMLQTLVPRLAAGTWETVVQDDGLASYCAGRRAEDGLIDWSQDADAIDRLIRAVSAPYPGAFTFTRKRRLTIWEAEPIDLPNPWHAADGQIVLHDDGAPVVRCGDGRFLRLLRYDTDDGAPLIGQPRLFSTPTEGAAA